MHKPEGEQLEVALEEMKKILNCGESLSEIGKNIGTSRQNIFSQKEKGFMTPHSALAAEKCGKYGVKKEKLRPDLTPEKWEILEKSIS